MKVALLVGSLASTLKLLDQDTITLFQKTKEDIAIDHCTSEKTGWGRHEIKQMKTHTHERGIDTERERERG